MDFSEELLKKSTGIHQRRYRSAFTIMIAAGSNLVLGTVNIEHDLSGRPWRAENCVEWRVLDI